jgi:hypothetical protein
MREIRHTICDPDHFRFPRQSHIPRGYLGRYARPWWPRFLRFLRALFAWACFAGVAFGLAVFAMGVAQ